jgi:hypothetical protein
MRGAFGREGKGARRTPGLRRSTRSRGSMQGDGRMWMELGRDGQRGVACPRGSTVPPRMAPTVSCVAFIPLIFELQRMSESAWASMNAFPSSSRSPSGSGKPRSARPGATCASELSRFAHAFFRRHLVPLLFHFNALLSSRVVAFRGFPDLSMPSQFPRTSVPQIPTVELALTSPP